MLGKKSNMPKSKKPPRMATLFSENFLPVFCARPSRRYSPVSVLQSPASSAGKGEFSRDGAGGHTGRITVLEPSDSSDTESDTRRRSLLKDCSAEKSMKAIETEEGKAVVENVNISEKQGKQKEHTISGIGPDDILEFLESPKEFWRPVLFSAQVLMCVMCMLITATIYEEIGHFWGGIVFAGFCTVAFGPPLVRIVAWKVIDILKRLDEYLMELRKDHGEFQDSDEDSLSSDDHVVLIDELSDASDDDDEDEKVELLENNKTKESSKKEKKKSWWKKQSKKKKATRNSDYDIDLK